MKQMFIRFGLVLCLMIGTAPGQGGDTRFELDSRNVGIKYTIEVVMPSGDSPPGTKLPVVYCMDWFILGDYLKSLPRLMELGRLAEPCILVGIAQGQTTDDWAVMRTRDYTPRRASDEYSIKNTYPKALELAGGARKFTAFLRDELIPIIEEKYPCDPSRRCIAGYSLGGLLGVHLLINCPELFQDYLLGSPSLWWNDFSLAKEFKDVPMDRFKGIHRVYLSVGEEESWEMLKGFDLLRSVFKEKGFEGSRIKTEIIPGNGHVGAMPTALYNGFRFLFRNR